jgi:hypothetical protein
MHSKPFQQVGWAEALGVLSCRRAGMPAGQQVCLQDSPAAECPLIFTLKQHHSAPAQVTWVWSIAGAGEVLIMSELPTVVGVGAIPSHSLPPC